MKNASKHVIAAILLVPLILLAACSDSHRTTLRIKADLSSIAEDKDPAAAIQETVDILAQRVEQFGAGDAEITAEGDVIAVLLTGMDEEVARQLLLPRGVLEFRQPLRAETGFVACRDAAGNEFFVHPLRVNADSAAQSLARCFGQDQAGDALWESTPTIFVQTQEFSLAELIEPGSWEIRNEASLAPRFNDAGTELLEDVTSALVGYRLGVFIDGTLIAAPRIQRPITNGNPVISGFGEVNARIHHAQLNVAPLPATLRQDGESN